MSRPDYGALPKILEQMNKEGGFTISSLVRDDGFSIASAVAPGTDRDIVAAVSGFISNLVIFVISTSGAHREKPSSRNLARVENRH